MWPFSRKPEALPDGADVPEIVRYLEKKPLLAPARARALNKVHIRKAMSRMLRTGETFGQATGGPDFINQPHDDFRRTLKEHDDDLTFQVEWLVKNLNTWFAHGEPPAPYPAWRIAIILRKSGQHDLEYDFLRAWCRHFHTIPVGRRNETINERYRKMVEKARSKAG